jgi:hypothetical protein
MRRVLQMLAGVVVGYALMVVLITLVQETWFGGVGWSESPLGELVAAGMLTCAAGAVGAGVGTWIARRSRVPGRVMAALVVVETTTLLLTGRLSGPLWFDLLAAASLIGAILLGAEIVARGGLSRRAAAARPLAR